MGEGHSLSQLFLREPREFQDFHLNELWIGGVIDFLQCWSPKTRDFFFFLLHSDPSLNDLPSSPLFQSIIFLFPIPKIHPFLFLFSDTHIS
jgi:hypothetical protein